MTVKAKDETKTGPGPSKVNKEVVDVEAWGQKVEVRSMSINTKIAMATAEDEGNYVSCVVIGTCYDPDSGKKLFSSDDAEWLDAEPSGSPVEDLLTKAFEVSGLTEDTDAGKADS